MNIKTPHLLFAVLLSFISVSPLSLAEDIEFEDEQEKDDETFLYDDFIYEDAFSDEVYSDTRFFLSVDALYGGETLQKVYFKNGESDRLRGGAGVSLSLGIAQLIFNKKVDVGIKAGYLFNTVTAKNSLNEKNKMSFNRIPIDVFSHYWIGQHSLGGGLTAHLAPKFTTEKGSNTAHYETAFGSYIEYMFFLSGAGSALGVKYLNIDYKNKSTHKISHAGTWGITFSQVF